MVAARLFEIRTSSLDGVGAEFHGIWYTLDCDQGAVFGNLEHLDLFTGNIKLIEATPTVKLVRANLSDISAVTVRTAHYSFSFVGVVRTGRYSS
jgi:hypothetical protein